MKCSRSYKFVRATQCQYFGISFTKVLKKQPESYFLDKGQNSYFYLNVKANDNQREFLEIIDDTKIDELEKAILKSEEPKQ